MATEIRDASGALIGHQLEHTAQQLDDAVEGVDGMTQRVKRLEEQGTGVDPDEVTALIAQYIADNHITGVSAEEIQEMVDAYMQGDAIEQSVQDWLDSHPEATTTVADGAISKEKLSAKLLEEVHLRGGNMLGNTEQSEDTSTWAGLFQKVKNEVTQYCKGDYQKIPIILFTDSHTMHKGKREIFKTINDLVNWDEVSAFMNLGDCVFKGYELEAGASVYGTALDYSKILDTNTALEDLLVAVQDIPLDKQINVFGNHDTWTWVAGKNYGTATSDQKHLQQYFRNIKARRHGNNGWFTVIDDYRNVKYIAISAYENETTTYGGNKKASTEQIDFLINEMSADDGYDIIILCHESLYPDWDNRLIPTTSDLSSSTINSDNYWAGLDTNPIFYARKTKTAGTFTDADGVVHNFDFSNAKSELLCALGGHMHYDVYSYINDVVLCSNYSAFTREGMWVYYIVVDRRNQCIKAWKCDTVNLEYLTFTMPFEVPESSAKYRLTRKLLNCKAYTISNFIRAGQPYAQRIVADTGKTLGGIKVEMGGSDVTSTALSNDGYIFIPEATGDIKVTAVDSDNDIDTPFYAVVANYGPRVGDLLIPRGGDTSATRTWIVNGDGQQFGDARGISVPDDYTYDLTVEMGGVDITMSVTSYSRGLATVTIPAVTDDVIITANAREAAYESGTIDVAGNISESSSDYLSPLEDVSMYSAFQCSAGATGAFSLALYDGGGNFLMLIYVNSSSPKDSLGFYLGKAPTFYTAGNVKYAQIRQSSRSHKIYGVVPTDDAYNITYTIPAGITGANQTSVTAGDKLDVTLRNTYDGTTLVGTVKMGNRAVNTAFDAETGRLKIPYVGADVTIDVEAKYDVSWTKGTANMGSGVLNPNDTSTYSYSNMLEILQGVNLRGTSRQDALCYDSNRAYIGKGSFSNVNGNYMLTLLEHTKYVVLYASNSNLNAGYGGLFITAKSYS